MTAVSPSLELFDQQLGELLEQAVLSDQDLASCDVSPVQSCHSDTLSDSALQQLKSVQRHSVHINGSQPIISTTNLIVELAQLLVAMQLNTPTLDHQMKVMSYQLQALAPYISMSRIASNLGDLGCCCL